MNSTPQISPVQYKFLHAPDIYLAESQEQLKFLAEKYEIATLPLEFEEMSGLARLCSFKGDAEMFHVVYFPKIREEHPAQVLLVLLHEAVHIWQAYSDVLNEHEPSIEFEAYGIESFFKALMDSYMPDWANRLK